MMKPDYRKRNRFRRPKGRSRGGFHSGVHHCLAFAGKMGSIFETMGPGVWGPSNAANCPTDASNQHPASEKRPRRLQYSSRAVDRRRMRLDGKIVKLKSWLRERKVLDSMPASTSCLDSGSDTESDSSATGNQEYTSRGYTGSDGESSSDESSVGDSSNSIEDKTCHLHMRGGNNPGNVFHHVPLEDDERVPAWIWFMAGARPGHPTPTGAQLRTWKEKSRGNWPEGKKRGFFAEIVFVLSHGRFCRHHPGCKPARKDPAATEQVDEA